MMAKRLELAQKEKGMEVGRGDGFVCETLPRNVIRPSARTGQADTLYGVTGVRLRKLYPLVRRGVAPPRREPYIYDACCLRNNVRSSPTSVERARRTNSCALYDVVSLIYVYTYMH